MKTHRQKAEDRQGFALIVSVTLMSFIFLLIIALASLTSLETQSALHVRQEIEAQQNALVALDLALGELQKYAGPDQRVTARADLEYGAAAAQPYWTAVYGSSIAPDYDATPEEIATTLTDPTKVNAQGSSAKLLNWLVSGNEVGAFDPSSDVGTTGEILNVPSASSIAYNPGLGVSNIGSASATSTNLTIRDTSGVSQPARLLVGPSSAGSSDDFVAAPLVRIAGDTANGGYAWWVGDEGIKARADLPLPTDTEDKQNAFVNSSRAAIEMMAKGEYGIDQTESLQEARIDTAYDPLSSLSRVSQTSDLTLSSANPDDFSEIVKYRFHDITTHSESVIADTYAGGLKRDLSTLLDESYAPSVDDPTADDKRLFTPHSGDLTGYAIPTWKHLRSFAQTQVPVSGTDAFKIAPRLPVHDQGTAPDDVGIAPVLTYFSLGFRAAPAGPPAAGVDINMNLYPLVVLWNPYNFTIKAPAVHSSGGNYEVGLFPTWGVTVALHILDPGDAGVKVYDPETGTTSIVDTPYTWRSKDVFNFTKHVEGNSDVDKFIRFRLNCPDIPPGESLIFSLPIDSSGNTYDSLNLPILNNIEPEPLSYVSVPFSSFETTEEAGKQFRLAEAYYYQREQTLEDGTKVSIYGNPSKSFSNGGDGKMYAYLGEPVTNPVEMTYLTGTTVDFTISMDPSINDRRWYQTHQGIGWDGSAVDEMDFEPLLIIDKNGDAHVRNESGSKISLQQEPDVLTYEPPKDGSPPAYVMLTQALFSGGGSNAQLNANQNMLTTRWIGQGNMRAARSGRTRRDKNYNPLFIATTGTNDLAITWQRFQSEESPSNRASAGQGHDWLNGEPVDTTLFELPYEDQPLFSIGQLQHANLSFVGAYPSYPIGNSLADYRLHSKSGPNFPDSPAGYQIARVDHLKPGSSTPNGLAANQVGYYDISFLLNRTLWDRYFFSTVPPTGSIPDELPNARLAPYGSKDIRDPDEAAAGLLTKGGFNINSTSEQAWRAVLGGTNQLDYDPENPASSGGSKLDSSISRFTRPTSGDSPNAAWEGYRTLSEEQIAQLARNIVTEIRNRGPFVSLSDFVNRRLVDNPDTDDSIEYENFRGTIQAAIDRTQKTSAGGGAFAPNDAGTGSFWEEDFDLLDTARIKRTSQFGEVYDITQFLGGDAEESPYSNLSSFAPKYITQADVLSAIGSSISARSDTFVIRAYGEVNDTFSTDEVVARAWCEAVVQRYPEYIRNVDEPEDKPNDAENIQFGRQFKVISFRWLSADEV